MDNVFNSDVGWILDDYMSEFEADCIESRCANVDEEKESDDNPDVYEYIKNIIAQLDVSLSELCKCFRDAFDQFDDYMGSMVYREIGRDSLPPRDYASLTPKNHIYKSQSIKPRGRQGKHYGSTSTKRHIQNRNRVVRPQDLYFDRTIGPKKGR